LGVYRPCNSRTIRPGREFTRKTSSAGAATYKSGNAVTLLRRRLDAHAAVLREALLLAAAGAAAGILLAVASTPTMSPFLFRVSPYDPLILAATEGVLLVIALLSAWLPATRAASADPVRALNTE
jgi:FtsX-like permease family protein